jgi:hypothetical protein
MKAGEVVALLLHCLLPGSDMLDGGMNAIAALFFYSEAIDA